MQVIASPPGLLNGSLYDQLSNEIYRVYTKKVQQTETYEKKVELWRDFFLCIKVSRNFVVMTKQCTEIACRNVFVIMRYILLVQL